MLPLKVPLCSAQVRLQALFQSGDHQILSFYRTTSSFTYTWQSVQWANLQEHIYKASGKTCETTPHSLVLLSVGRTKTTLASSSTASRYEATSKGQLP